MLLSRQWVDRGELPHQTRAFLQREFPERVIQIGEGNFLRGFVDWLIHQLNHANLFGGSVVVVAPRPNGHAKIDQLNHQDGLFTVWLQGTEHGTRINAPEVVSSVRRSIDLYEDWEGFLHCAEQRSIDICVSNTTEAGITYQAEEFQTERPFHSFPAKLTAYLYRRYCHFDGDKEAGMTIIPCELVEGNGDLLRDLVIRHATRWNLPSSFQDWIRVSNTFCNTLVDRIVTGAPEGAKRQQFEAELPYEDPLLTVGEPFHLWVIESAAHLESVLPFAQIGLNVKFVGDVRPYWTQKVRMLNGTHTALAYLAYLHGCRTVLDAMTDETVSPFIHALLHEEIVPMVEAELKTIDREDIQQFATQVLERFENPFLEHHLLDIAQNGLSKFSVRLLPVFEQFAELRGRVPARLCACFAAMLVFYRGTEFGETIPVIRDDPAQVSRLSAVWAGEAQVGLVQTVKTILGLTDVWGRDLNPLAGLCDGVVQYVTAIREIGVQGLVGGLSNG